MSLQKSTKKNILVLASGHGTNFEYLLHNSKCISVNIVGLLYNKEHAGCKNIALNNNIPCYFYPLQADSRADYDKSVAEKINSVSPDLVVLAGWMHVFGQSFFDTTNIPCINLHPALPGEYPGANAIKSAFEDYQKGNTTRSGIMVHEVTPEVDVGKVYYQMEVPFKENDTFGKFEYRMKTFEKAVLLQGILARVNELETVNDNHKLVYTGKTRQVYDISYGNYLIECSNRLSAMDKYRCDIPGKGEILTYTTSSFFRNTKHICDNHYLYHKGNKMVVRKTEPVKLEFILRRYLTGSLYKKYKHGTRTFETIFYEPVTLPDGLEEYSKLDTLLFTPTTKGTVDVPITSEQIVKQGYLTDKELKYIKIKTKMLFEYAEMYYKNRDMTLVDTKFEFGRIGHKLVLIDEIFTPDSSRFWKLGNPKTPLDKDIIRNYIKENTVIKCHVTIMTSNEPKSIPQELIENTTKVYKTFYDTAIGHKIYNLDVDLTEFVDRYYSFVHKELVVVIAGSDADNEFVVKIKKELAKQEIYSKSFVASAHKTPDKVQSILKFYNKVDRKVLYVTVAGRSNALSGFVSANTNRPTFACPPYKDKLDMQVNLHSTIQMPSKVPAMTVLEPSNLAIAIKNILNL